VDGEERWCKEQSQEQSVRHVVLFALRPMPSVVLTEWVEMWDVGWPPSFATVCLSPRPSSVVWDILRKGCLPRPQVGMRHSGFPFSVIGHVVHIPSTHPAQDAVDSNPRSPPPPTHPRLSSPRGRPRQARRTRSSGQWRDPVGRERIQPAHAPQENLVCRYPVYRHG